MANVDTIDITKLILVEQGSTPATPAAGKDVLFIRTSDHLLCTVNSSGTVTPWGGALTNPMTTAGDIIIGGASGAPARLALAAAGKVPTGTGSSVAASYPPGYEFSYVEFTSDKTSTHTTEATSDTVVASASVAYDGSTIVNVEFYCPILFPPTVDGGKAIVLLYEDSTVLGQIAVARTSSAATAIGWPCHVSRRLTPSNASHTYTIKLMTTAGTANASAGAGGTGAEMPGFIRITKVA